MKQKFIDAKKEARKTNFMKKCKAIKEPDFFLMGIILLCCIAMIILIVCPKREQPAPVEPPLPYHTVLLSQSAQQSDVVPEPAPQPDVDGTNKSKVTVNTDINAPEDATVTVNTKVNIDTD